MSVGSVINYGVTLWMMSRFPSVRPQAAALAGIAIGTLSNFIASRYLVFKRGEIVDSSRVDTGSAARIETHMRI